jgi:dTDP-3-amino-3,4,6-trideoxy-alpha-D-glucose transaminase
VGYNSRLDELQAAVLRVQLPHLDAWADGRRQAAEHYEEAGLGELVTLPKPVAGSAPAWHLYVISHPQIVRIEAALADAGVGRKAYYRTPVHLQAPMGQWAGNVQLPATERVAADHLAIPMSPVLTREQAEEVLAAVRRAA